MAACLLSGRAGEAAALAAFRALRERGLTHPAAVAGARPEEVARVLEASGYPRAERAATVLWRGCRSLAERYGGSPSRLAAGADGLDELGARLAGLARGVGAGTVACFLRPLRVHWSAASDLPLSPAAAAAATCLGVAWDGDADLEAALDRLGRRSCLGQRPERCPLGARCPLR